MFRRAFLKAAASLFGGWLTATAEPTTTPGGSVDEIQRYVCLYPYHDFKIIDNTVVFTDLWAVTPLVLQEWVIYYANPENVRNLTVVIINETSFKHYVFSDFLVTSYVINRDHNHIEAKGVLSCIKDYPFPLINSPEEEFVCE